MSPGPRMGGLHASCTYHSHPFYILSLRRWDAATDLIKAFVIDLVAGNGTRLLRYDFAKLGSSQTFTFGERAANSSGCVLTRGA